MVPRALTVDELPGIAEDYARAARRAIHAGFDGAEIHAANGYLLDQFIRDASNRRRDDFGGSIERRWRFPIQVTQAVIDEIGASRTGIRVSPYVSFNSMRDSDPVATFTYGARELSRRGIAYGVPFIANPDLPARFRTGATLNVAGPGDVLLARLEGLHGLSVPGPEGGAHGQRPGRPGRGVGSGGIGKATAE